MYKFLQGLTKAFDAMLSKLTRQRSRVGDVGGDHYLVLSDSQHDVSGSLNTVLHEIGQTPRSLQEMSRHIELCRRALSLVDKGEDSFLWATLHLEIADSLIRIPKASSVENVELAIKHYNQALEGFRPETDPKDWAQVQHNLAIVYRRRIRGARAENLEQAIAHAYQALTVCTPEVDPELWARTHNNLASSYRDRIHGERAENLEEVIAHAQQALTVYTREAFPADWAKTQHNLMGIYLERIRGERAENLEQAIRHAHQALTVHTAKAEPELWAKTLHNLAIVYRRRIRGERAENLEQAITYAYQALTVYTPELYPEFWAGIQDNLASAYQLRICGDRAENLEQAIAHYQQALAVRTRETDRANWAKTEHNLASAYQLRIHGDRAENLEQAIAHYQQALAVTTREAAPERWALIQNSLANAYRRRIRGAEEENLEQAIAHYQQALTVHSREAFPVDWAAIQNNLLSTYRDHIRGERAENLKEAITHAQQALTVYTREAFPINFLTTQQNLGYLHAKEGEWKSALTAYQEAARVGEMLFDAAYTEPGRQAEVAEIADLYALTAYALLKAGRPGEALVQLEQSKIRLLSQALALNEVDLTCLPQSQQNILRSLRQTLRALETEMRLPADTPTRRDHRELAQALNHVRTELKDAIARIRVAHPEFMSDGLVLPEILALIPPGAALVAPLVTSQGSAVFVVPAGLQSVGSEHVLWVDSYKEDDLQILLRVLTEEAQLSGWLGAYSNARTNVTAWLDTIETTGRILWADVIAPIAERLEALKVTQVLLMPQGGLGLLPLHAAWHEVNGIRRYFIDEFAVTYLPSGYAHKVSLERIKDPQRYTRSVVAIINPTDDLPFTASEGEQVARLFHNDKSTVLSGEAATAEAVRKQGFVGYVHFACHGFYQWDDPMQSGLKLANHEPLTLTQIGQLNLNKTRLITLSACETGITDIRQSPDEYLGLPAGFLQAGTPAVISTLWAVNDLSTMLLMERFYCLHLKKEMAIPEALRQAQLWLRDVTARELAQRFADEEDALLSSTRMSINTASDYFTRFTNLDPEEKPFAHPYYWAAFTFSGA